MFITDDSQVPKFKFTKKLNKNLTADENTEVKCILI